jgi:hypothetical protein
MTEKFNATFAEKALDVVLWSKYTLSLGYSPSEDNSILRFFICCNDVFCMAADSVEITEENIGILEQSFKDLPDDLGDMLFCARASKCRPLNSFYNYIPKEQWPLFDVCGEERDETNPYNGGARPK